jgi:urea transport system ATP-binding protein
MVLALKGLKAGYQQSLVLTGLDLEVPAGQIVCLIGRNGVGKTTLLKTIMGLLPAQGGQITLDGQDITRRSTHARARAGIGYVPQGRGVFPYLSVYENLLMGLEAARSRDGAAIEIALALFPGLRPLLKKVAGTLSGGQQQQLAIARVLLRRPSLLLLDEPTEGIQPSIIDEIEETILRIHETDGVSVLLVEQYLEFALAMADYCYVMEKGAIVAEGPAEKLDNQSLRDYLAV